MNRSDMKISILISKPGSEKDILSKGIKEEAFVDPTSEISMVPTTVVQKVYEGLAIPYGQVQIGMVTGTHKFVTVPLTIGVSATNNNVFLAQVECMSAEFVEATIIGCDVLRQLGLIVTFDYDKNRVLLHAYNWQTFEEEVAAIYRSLGAKVRQNVNLSGLQIDLLVEETTSSRQQLRLAVECKYYKEHVGNRIVNDFARVVHTLKNSDLINKGVIVSASGFTQDAHLVAAETGIELISIDDLRQILVDKGITLTKLPIQTSSPPQRPSLEYAPQRKRELKVFIAMPFSPELDDVYYLGILEIVAKLGGVCERLDEMQYVGGVVEKIYDSIRTADLVIGEVSNANPNVYYEIGFAHALGKPVILLTKSVENTPFDLRGYRHVIYSTIVELRNRLESILRALMQLDE